MLAGELEALSQRESSTTDEAGLCAGASGGDRRHSTALSLVPTPHVAEQLPHSPALNEKEHEVKDAHAWETEGLY